MMKRFLSEYAHSAVADADERLTHIYNEKNSIFNFINGYRVPTLDGSETDKQMVEILYAMPWNMRKGILTSIRQHTENLPALIAPEMDGPGSAPRSYNPLLDAANKILAEATKEYLLKLAEQQDGIIIEELPS